jgi:N-acetylglucosamine kinase-like BadF-type ATPase
MNYKIGIDGGGTKTECILVSTAGEIVTRHLAPGSNPGVVGIEQAKLIATDALCAVAIEARRRDPDARIVATQFYMSGSPLFWREFAATLTDFGRITTETDSLPVLELATRGHPGLVIHAGTGSFVSARDPGGRVHYAGGLGWRFGDPGSGYDLGRRAVARALLELQGWAPPSRFGPTIRDYTSLGDTADAAAVTRFFYYDPAPNQKIAGLAPAILRLAKEGDRSATALVAESVGELIDLATRVATKLFPDTPVDAIPAGLSGSILTQPVVLDAIVPRSPLPLTVIQEPAIEGVRELLIREPW